MWARRSARTSPCLSPAWTPGRRAKYYTPADAGWQLAEPPTTKAPSSVGSSIFSPRVTRIAAAAAAAPPIPSLPMNPRTCRRPRSLAVVQRALRLPRRRSPRVESSRRAAGSTPRVTQPAEVNVYPRRRPARVVVVVVVGRVARASSGAGARAGGAERLTGTFAPSVGGQTSARFRPRHVSAAPPGVGNGSAEASPAAIASASSRALEAAAPASIEVAAAAAPPRASSPSSTSSSRPRPDPRPRGPAYVGAVWASRASPRAKPRVDPPIRVRPRSRPDRSFLETNASARAGAGPCRAPPVHVPLAHSPAYPSAVRDPRTRGRVVTLLLPLVPFEPLVRRRGA